MKYLISCVAFLATVASTSANAAVENERVLKSHECICPQPMCMAGAFCPSYECNADGECVAQEPDCKEDSHCPQPRCATGFPCPSFVCQAGHCVAKEEPECMDSSHCPVPSCLPGAFCPSFECVKGECVLQEKKAECEDTDECPQHDCVPDTFCPNYICLDGSCVPEKEEPQCKDDSHCPVPTCLPGHFCPHYICVGGECVQQEDRIVCTMDAKECPDGSSVSRQGPNCEFEACPKQCKDNSHCPQHRCIPGIFCPAFICVEGQCLPEEKKPQCQKDFECPQPTCLTGTHCPMYICVEGECIPKKEEPMCKDNSQCPQPSCVPGGYCPSFICVDGDCIEDEPITCRAVKQCPDGSFIPACDGSPDCPTQCDKARECPQIKCSREAGAFCPEILCVDGQCVPDSECAQNSHCPQMACLVEPCPSIVCEDGKCVAEDEPECRDDSQCQQVDCLPGTFCPALVCSKGQCVPEAACRDDSHCPQPLCVPGGFCPSIICVEGNCVEDEPACKDDSQCPQIRCAVAPCPLYICAKGECVMEEIEERVVCQKDLKICPDGLQVSRQAPECEFAPCHLQCKEENDCGPQPGCQPNLPCTHHRCEDGQCVPDERIFCTEELMECPDGSFVAREETTCKFPPCPEDPEDREPEDREPECKDDIGCPQPRCAPNLPCFSNNCIDGQCVPEETIFCTEEAMKCPDGSTVSRDGPKCEFAKCPEYTTNVPLAPTNRAPAKTGGDPHFRTWSGIKYDYHGECDLVLLDHPSFADGLGMKVHIRTTRIKYFSFIETIVVLIGKETLEFSNDLDNYLINGKKVVDGSMGSKNSIAGYEIRRFHKAISVRLDKRKHHNNHAHVDLYYRKNGFPYVKFDGKETDIFKGSSGLLGDYATGKMMSRDSSTEIKDATKFALEWQVRDDEPMLFSSARFPQFPTKCTPPNKRLGKRLGDTHMQQMAEEACAGWGEDKDECVFDVMATRDVNGAEPIGRHHESEMALDVSPLR